MPENPTRAERYQALDIWRGIICLFVVLEHAVVALWQGSGDAEGGGYLRTLIVAPFRTNWGTPLFFVISGYCIAASLESSRRKGRSPSHFLARRLWRVFPPYWMALAGFACLVMTLDLIGLARVHQGPYTLALPSVDALDGSQWLGNLTLTETWRPLVAGARCDVFTRVAWSLCYQEQFYLVCFLALLLTRGSLARTLGIATVAILAVRVVAGDIGAISRIDGTFPMLWHQFAIGLVAYWALSGLMSSARKRATLVGLALTALLGMYGRDGATAISALFGLAMILMHRWDHLCARARLLDPLRALGRCSYSVYLAHLPVIVLVSGGLGEVGVTHFWARAFLTVPISAVLGVAAGLAFYHGIESRFLELPTLRKPSDFGAMPPTSHGLAAAACRSGLVPVRISA